MAESPDEMFRRLQTEQRVYQDQERDRLYPPWMRVGLGLLFLYWLYRRIG
jgi:hypothetical protein